MSDNIVSFMDKYKEKEVTNIVMNKYVSLISIAYHKLLLLDQVADIGLIEDCAQVADKELSGDDEFMQKKVLPYTLDINESDKYFGMVDMLTNRIVALYLEAIRR